MNKRGEKLDAINLNNLIDLTLLDPRATVVDIEKLCDIAYKNQYYAICINPCNVLFAKGYILKNLDGALKIVSVVGFPLGASSMSTKVHEVKQVLAEGADEIDVVINIGRAKSMDYEYIKDELKIIKKIAKKHIVKAIIETCYFDENEIIKLCKICISAGVDYIKTSTGFGTSGANEDVINILLNETKGKCLIKASGGITTRSQAIHYVNMGVRRIGTSTIL
ncbi:MAG: deoxyribose-phosphate aldolase [Clostridia bacterium]|nr:deoxyribose-phosphate aldolase [Clostridia bacterium]